VSVIDAIDPRFDLNPTLPGISNPYPIYRAVRESDPVHWCPGANLWAVMRHDNANIVLKDARLSRQAFLDNLEARTGPQPIIEMQRHELVFIDNPRHGELRRFLHTAINARAVSDLQAQIDLLVEQKLAPLLARGKFDVIGDFLLTLPTSIASAWLGVPEQDRSLISEWIFPLVAGRGVARDPETTAAANPAAEKLRAYFRELMDQRRHAPASDLISGLLAVQFQQPALLSDEILFPVLVAIFAGGHTPGIALIACTLLALFEFPDQLAQIRSKPDLLPAAVEEGLRFNSPTQAPNPLTAIEDISLRGKTIRKGDALTVILASANRDPDAFPDPDRFDLARPLSHHLAFSTGPHACLGTILARMLAVSALRALTELPGLQMACAPTQLRWIPDDRFRMLASLPVTFRESSA
jgi:pimeloyl-[acyl-carrier protein] synthase